MSPACPEQPWHVIIPGMAAGRAVTASRWVMGRPAATRPEPDDPHSARDDETQLSAAPIGRLPAPQLKARAARTRDIDDLRLLADIIGVDSAGTALRICADFYPDEPVSPRSAAVLQELFG
jgi:hypothetical protein